MILDAIISFFALVFGPLVAGTGALAILIVNLLATLVEAVVGLFYSGFRLRRIQRKKTAEDRRADLRAALVTAGVIIFVVAAVLLWPRLANREVTLVATDGHSLPFAAVIVHQGQEDKHVRTDAAGMIKVPRFGTTALSVKDPRYVSKRWSSADLAPNLVVERTILGSGLDRLSSRLLQRKDDE